MKLNFRLGLCCLSAWVLICCSQSGLLTAGVDSHRSTLKQDKVKASYLFHFLKYVQWQLPKGKALTVAVVDDESLFSILKKVEQKRVWGRSIRVLHVKDEDKIPSGIQMLYSSRPEIIRASTSPQVKGRLLVGDYKGALADGAMINFFEKNNKVKFELHYTRCEALGVQVSSKLLSVAKVVK